MKLADLAGALGLAVDGDGAVEISGLAGLEDAGPYDLSFATGPRYVRAYAASRGGAFIVPLDFDAVGRSVLRSANPYLDFARAVDVLMPPLQRPEPGVHPTAVVATHVRLGESVSIGAYAVVGRGCRIGDRSVVHPHVTLYAGVQIGVDCVVHSGACLREGTRLGDRVLVKNGAVIGSDGFGHMRGPDGRRLLISHRCAVEIGDDCEVGANTTIDASHPGQLRRGHAETRTRIGDGTKIDNLVQIAHGCDLGEGGTLCAQVGLAGTTSAGRDVLWAGQAASAGHLEVGDGALIGGRAAVAADLQPGAQVLGTPAMERRAWGRFVVTRKRIPELFRRVRRIEEALGLRSGEGDG